MEDVRIAGRQDANEEDTAEIGNAAEEHNASKDETRAYKNKTTEEDTVNINYNLPISELKGDGEDQEMPETEMQTKEDTSKDDIERKVACIFCEFETIDMAIMKNHVNDHPKEDIYHCKICDRPLKKTSLREHIQSIHSGFRLDCPECDFQTNTRSSLNLHRFNKHNIGSKPFQCHKCSYKTKLRNFLKRHLQEKHDIDLPREDSGNCDQCVYSTNNASSLKMHKIRRHKADVTETNIVKTELIV